MASIPIMIVILLSVIAGMIIGGWGHLIALVFKSDDQKIAEQRVADMNKAYHRGYREGFDEGIRFAKGVRKPQTATYDQCCKIIGREQQTEE